MRIRIFVGAGGVGKTSVTAASALRQAIDEGKTLVLTIDPALRLKTALHLNVGPGSQERIAIEGYSPRGELWAALLDIRTSLDRMVRRDASAAEAEAVLRSPVYGLLTSSIAGMQELMAVERIHQAIEDGFEFLFVDTAPARHAFEFLDNPELFVELVRSPMVQLIGRSYKWWEGSILERLTRGAAELYTSVESLIGMRLTKEILNFFAVFQSAAEQYAGRARRTVALLRDPQVTRFTIVSSPAQALKDAAYFYDELAKRHFCVDTLVVNRMWPALPYAAPPDLSHTLARSVEWYRQVSAIQLENWNEIMGRFSAKIASILAVPELSPQAQGLDALYQMARCL